MRPRHGQSNTFNLFVPVFNTESGGSGIGLVLTRQITEAHGGLLLARALDFAQGSEDGLHFRPLRDPSRLQVNAWHDSLIVNRGRLAGVRLPGPGTGVLE